MNDSDKVIIALGFFTLVGFISYLYFLRMPPTTTAPVSLGISKAELMKDREERWYELVRR